MLTVDASCRGICNPLWVEPAFVAGIRSKPTLEMFHVVAMLPTLQAALLVYEVQLPNESSSCLLAGEQLGVEQH
jgi:hypothetical protein